MAAKRSDPVLYRELDESDADEIYESVLRYVNHKKGNAVNAVRNVQVLGVGSTNIAFKVIHNHISYVIKVFYFGVPPERVRLPGGSPKASKIAELLEGAILTFAKSVKLHATVKDTLDLKFVHNLRYASICATDSLPTYTTVEEIVTESHEEENNALSPPRPTILLRGFTSNNNGHVPFVRHLQRGYDSIKFVGYMIFDFIPGEIPSSIHSVRKELDECIAILKGFNLDYRDIKPDNLWVRTTDAKLFLLDLDSLCKTADGYTVGMARPAGGENVTESISLEDFPSCSAVVSTAAGFMGGKRYKSRATRRKKH